MKKLLTLILLLPSIVFATKTIELNENNTINFNQAFTSQYVATKQIEAINKCNQNPNSDIYLVLNSPGGSISAGKLLFDTLNSLPCFFHTVTIFAASMGYQTVQNLNKRYIIPSGVLMSHRASISGLNGEIGGELDQILKLIKTEVKEMEVYASNRVGISLEKYRNLIRDELWMTAEESVENNHADEIVLVKCSESLLGTSIVKVRTFFGEFDVEFSNCPIVTAPLGVSGGREAEAKIKDYYNNLSKHSYFTL